MDIVIKLNKYIAIVNLKKSLGSGQLWLDKNVEHS